MTKEELLAEEHICNGKCQDDITKNYVHCKTCTRLKDFLAGYKVGRPQRHDLRKNPNDLPKKNKSYWVYIDCQGNKIYRSIVWQGCWLGWNCVALAWCEEPQFEE